MLEPNGDRLVRNLVSLRAIGRTGRYWLAAMLLAPLWSVTAAQATTDSSTAARATTDSSRGPYPSRAELEAAVIRADSAAASAAVAAERQRQREIAGRLRHRLQFGDFEVGDRVVLRVAGLPALTDSFTVRAGRVLQLPDIPDIPLTGVLRSELRDHLHQHLRQYVIDPAIEVRPLVRIGVLGAVETPGFYAVPPDMLLSEALMVAGGPTREADVTRTTVRRGPRVVWTENRVHRAMRSGATLDDIDLRAGDEIVVGEKRDVNWTEIIRTAAYVAAVAVTVYAGGFFF